MKRKRILAFARKHRWSFLAVGIAALILIFISWDFLTIGGVDIPGINTNPKPKIVNVRAPLSGRLVSPEKASKTPVAVVVENHPDARPQSGLNDASYVIETFAEGGITRFLVFYQEKEPKEIGPVRSAREYFVEWANSYKMPFAHVGGNYDALTLIARLRVLDLNQFSLGNYFWRDTKRYAPHNVYTTYKKLIAAAKTKKYTLVSKVPAFSFKNDLKKEDRPKSATVKVNFNYDFGVTWAYRPLTNDYARFMLGAPHKERNTGTQIVAKNIVVAFSDFSNGRSQAGEQKVNIRTTGSGKAKYYQDGKAFEGTWKRTTASIMRFYDTHNKEIKLNAGTTWVEFVPYGTVVK